MEVEMKEEGKEGKEGKEGALYTPGTQASALTTSPISDEQYPHPYLSTQFHLHVSRSITEKCIHSHTTSKYTHPHPPLHGDNHTERDTQLISQLATSLSRE